MMYPGVHNPLRGITKGMPSHRTLAGTREQLDPTKCPHYIVPFVHTKFIDNKHSHRIVDVFRCVDCGKVHEEPRDLKTAGRAGSKDIEDPRVLKTLFPNRDVIDRFLKG